MTHTHKSFAATIAKAVGFALPLFLAGTASAQFPSGDGNFGIPGGGSTSSFSFNGFGSNGYLSCGTGGNAACILELDIEAIIDVVDEGNGYGEGEGDIPLEGFGVEVESETRILKGFELNTLPEVNGGPADPVVRYRTLPGEFASLGLYDSNGEIDGAQDEPGASDLDDVDSGCYESPQVQCDEGDFKGVKFNVEALDPVSIEILYSNIAPITDPSDFGVGYVGDYVLNDDGNIFELEITVPNSGLIGIIEEIDIGAFDDFDEPCEVVSVGLDPCPGAVDGKISRDFIVDSEWIIKARVSVNSPATLQKITSSIAKVCLATLQNENLVNGTPDCGTNDEFAGSQSSIGQASEPAPLGLLGLGLVGLAAMRLRQKRAHRKVA